MRKIGKYLVFGDDNTMEIKITPIPAALTDELRKLAIQLSHRGEPHRKVGKYLKTRMRSRFLHGKDEKGVSWKPLQPSTLQRRRAQGITGIKPLIATGKLLGQVHFQVINIQKKRGWRAATKGATVTRISAERLGTRNVKARVHQGFGVGTWVRNIPSRPYVGMSETEKRKVQDIFMKWFNMEIHGTVAKIRARTAGVAV